MSINLKLLFALLILVAIILFPYLGSNRQPLLPRAQPEIEWPPGYTENLNEQQYADIMQRQFSAAQFLSQLKTQQQQLRGDLQHADLVEQITLEREIALSQTWIEDYQSHYRQRLALYYQLHQALLRYKNYLMRNDYRRAQLALFRGDSGQAERMLEKIEAKFRQYQPGLEVSDAALSCFLRGQIASDRNDLSTAYRFFRRSVQYDPNNVRYLIRAGVVSNKIALYENAIRYLETALELQGRSQQTAVNPDVLMSLGSAWEGKGGASQALHYYQLAKNYYLKDHVESDPRVRALSERMARLR